MERDKLYKGNWYLPHNSDEVYSGIFHYNKDEGCYIEIFGAFEELIPKSRRHDVILGITIEGKAVTLMNCSRSNYTSSINGVTIAKYTATFAFIGEHFESIDEIQFDTIYVSVTDLWKWVGMYGVNEYKLGFDQWTIDLQYQKPNRLNFEISNELQLFFDFSISAPSIKNVDKFEIDQKTYIGLKASGSTSFKKLHRHLFTLYRFLCVAFYDSPPILELYVSRSLDDNGNRFKVEVLYSDYFLNRSYKAGKEEHEFLFCDKDVTHEFSAMISSWFTLFEKIAPAVNLLTLLLVKKEYPLELKFLCAVQAVETYHRNVYGGTEISEEAHNERLNAIVSSIPEKYKEWLEHNLKYSNELNLRKRLKDVYERTPKEITSQLIKKKSSFISSVVNARNYFTHYNPKLKNAIVSNGKLFTVTEKLKILLVCLLLCEIGLTDKMIVTFMGIHKVFPYLDQDE